MEVVCNTQMAEKARAEILLIDVSISCRSTGPSEVPKLALNVRTSIPSVGVESPSPPVYWKGRRLLSGTIKVLAKVESLFMYTIFMFFF